MLAVGYFIYFKITPVFFQWMFFISIKEINRLRKEINRLLSKGMSNIYLKVTIETFPKLRFYAFKFWKELCRFKVKESMHFVEKNINVSKNETESKMENPTHSSRETNLVLQLIDQLCASAHRPTFCFSS